MDDEDLTPEPVDVAAVLDNALNSPNPGTIIEALAPTSPTYVALRQALRSYRQTMAEAGAGHTAGPDGRLHARPAPVGSPASDGRIREILVNMERQRWLQRNLPADRVWVNTA